MVDGQTQVGVLQPRSRDWRVLTSDRSRGAAGWLAWSRDGSRIFYSRVYAKPLGIWSISPLGGVEKLVLENAASPEPLPDGSLLVARVTGSMFRLFHFWPETGKLDSLDAVTRLSASFAPNMRAFPDGKRVAYLGRPASDSTRPIGLYVLDFATEKSRLVWPPVGNNHVGYLPFCVSPDGSHITIAVPAGDAWDLQTIPSDGRTGPKTIATLQEVDGTSIDESADGTIYLSDVRFPLELQWTRPGSSSSERELIAATPSRARVLPLADGRIVVGIAGRVLVRPRGGGSLQPFVQTQSPTFSPLATLGRDRVALIFREQADSGIAIVDVATGRVLSRVRHSWPADWSSLAGAPGVHGVVRATADIDFLYRPTKKNIARLCAAMMDFGAPAEVIDERRHRLRCALPRRRRNR